jgi:DNA helicase-2/ATP-dependent DNA helicase PcrA
VFQLFGATYPEANVVVLSNNYRSTSDILLSSRRLISHNPNRMEFKYGISKASKNVYERHKKDSDQVPAVHHLNFSSTTEEEEAVVEKIKEIKQNAAEEDQQEPSIAILVRNNADIGRIARKLVQKGIQTNAFGLFYENPEIDLLMNFLSAVVKPSESRYKIRCTCNSRNQQGSLQSDRIPSVLLSSS